MTLNIKLSFYLTFILLLFSCGPKESEDLVNPPLKSESVYLRFINLAGDNQDRKLDLLAGTFVTESVPYGMSSPAFRPPADSATIRTILNEAPEYESEELIRWIRDLNYTFIALPNPDENAPAGAVDTIIRFRTTSSVPDITNNSYVKFLNAFPDSLSTFSLRIGCPNGEAINNNLTYKSFTSTAKPILSGNIAFSLVKTNQSGNEEIINLYQAELKARGQYTFIVYKTQSGEADLMMLDEEEITRESLLIPPVVTDRNSMIRTVNFSSEVVETYKVDGGTINSNVPPNYVANYATTTTCLNEFADTIQTKVLGNEVSRAVASLEVLKNYSVFVLDSGENIASETIVAPPLVMDEPFDGRAVIRVLHASTIHDGITVSLGARSDTEADGYQLRGYSSGTLLAEEITYGELSSKVYLSPGPIPINIFTSTQPARLLFVANSNIEPEKSYILVVKNDNQGNIVAALVPDDIENQAIEFLEESAAIQIVHAVYGRENLEVNLNPPLINAGKLFFGGSLGTVVPEGQNTITISGKQYSFEAKSDKRTLIIAAGENEDFDIFSETSDKLPLDYRYHTTRVIHVSKYGESMEVRLDTNQNGFTYGGMVYRDIIPPQEDVLERKLTYYFVDVNDYKNHLHVMTDVFLPHGKRYTILFAGKPGDYTSILIQEF